jgi:hypothetical protein
VTVLTRRIVLAARPEEKIGPRGIPQHVINRSVRLEGFVTADFAPDWADALGRLGQWLGDGTIKPFGQAVVRILPDPD